MPSLLKDLATRRFWRHFLVSAFATVGAIGALAGLVDVLFPETVRKVGTVGVLVVVAAAISSGLWRAWPRPIAQHYSKPDTTIRVVRGDLLTQPGHLVIGTCDTFDTAPPHIIARESLQGQALDRLFAGDLARLDQLLAHELVGVKPTETVQKPGKTDRYEVGTVAAIPYETRRLFFVAYTTMSEQNNAQGTTDGIWKSLRSLWRSVSAQSNGDPICIPVIGGGQARISQILPAQDSIRFIALSYMLHAREAPICRELRIVVRSEEYDRLDRLEIQAFLSSLAAS